MEIAKHDEPSVIATESMKLSHKTLRPLSAVDLEFRQLYHLLEVCLPGFELNFLMSYAIVYEITIDDWT